MKNKNTKIYYETITLIKISFMFYVFLTKSMDGRSSNDDLIFYTFKNIMFVNIVVITLSKRFNA